MGSRLVHTAAVILSLLLTPTPTTGQTQDASTPPRTPWGHPNLQGVWTNVGVTPLERAREFGGRELLTDEEVAALEEEAGGLRSFRQQTNEARDDAGDPRDELRLDRQGLNYNSVWYQQKTVSRRTSLIVDPSDGQIPPLTAEGERRAAFGLETNQRRGIDAIGRRGYDSYEERSLWERCLTRPLPRLPAHRRARLRPPLKRYVRFSRIPLSQGCPGAERWKVLTSGPSALLWD